MRSDKIFARLHNICASPRPHSARRSLSLWAEKAEVLIVVLSLFESGVVDMYVQQEDMKDAKSGSYM